MGYTLGVDLGSTRTVAVLLREDAEPQVCTIGEGSNAAPTAIYIGPDTSPRFGDAAVRLAATEPQRVVLGFSHRIGQETPALVGEDVNRSAYYAHDLAAAMVAWVVARVCEQEGASPQAVAVTHPAAWRPQTVELFRTALAAQHLPNLILVAEAAAAARAYAHRANVLVGNILAVYDLGGGSFDAAVLRAEPDMRFSLLGRPERRLDIGGAGLDHTLVSHVRGGLDAAARACLSDERAAEALRLACVSAKEALSLDTKARIALPDALDCRVVTLRRATFETVILGAVASTVRILDECLAAAGVSGRDVTAVLLVGGASRIPLVVQLISTHVEPFADVVLDLDPTTAVATGAALAAADWGAREPTRRERTMPVRALRRRPRLPTGRTRDAAGTPASAAAGAGQPAAAAGLELARLADCAAACAEEEAAARNEVAGTDHVVLAARARVEAAEAAWTEAATAARAEVARAAEVCAESEANARRAEAAHAEADAVARHLAAQAARARAAVHAHARAAQTARAAADGVRREVDERVARALAEVEQFAQQAIEARQQADAAAADRAGAAARAEAAAAAHAEVRAAARSAFESLGELRADGGSATLLPPSSPGSPDPAPAAAPGTHGGASAGPGALVPRRPVAKPPRPVADRAEDPPPVPPPPGPPQVARTRRARGAGPARARLHLLPADPEPDAARQASSRCLPIEGLEELLARCRGAS